MPLGTVRLLAAGLSAHVPRLSQLGCEAFSVHRIWQNKNPTKTEADEGLRQLTPQLEGRPTRAKLRHQHHGQQGPSSRVTHPGSAPLLLSGGAHWVTSDLRVPRSNGHPNPASRIPPSGSTWLWNKEQTWFPGRACPLTSATPLSLLCSAFPPWPLSISPKTPAIRTFIHCLLYLKHSPLPLPPISLSNGLLAAPSDLSSMSLAQGSLLRPPQCPGTLPSK